MLPGEACTRKFVAEQRSMLTLTAVVESSARNRRCVLLFPRCFCCQRCFLLFPSALFFVVSATVSSARRFLEGLRGSSKEVCDHHKCCFPICDRSFTCEDYTTYRAHPWSPFPLRRAHPGPGPHKKRVPLQDRALREKMYEAYLTRASDKSRPPPQP